VSKRPSHSPNGKQSLAKSRLTAEQLILFASLVCFIGFLWIIAFLLLPLISNGPAYTTWESLIVKPSATPGFILPATWTPTPAQPFLPTATATDVFDGTVPTRIYTPRPTSVSGIPWPVIPPRLTVTDLARIMQGESPGDKEAAYMVGWVAKNRLLHAGYGDNYAVVSHGFFGYRAEIQPNKEFMDIARRVIRSKRDPTGGSLYALSRTDITKLGISPSRADVASGEWFFFTTWPLASR
jgi:hypothetical protein